MIIDALNLEMLTVDNLTFATERLRIKPMNANNLAEFKLLQCDPNLMEFIGPILNESDLKEKFYSRIQCFDNNNEWFTLLVYMADSNEFIGSVGLKIDDEDFQRIEIGYLILKEYQGNGYVTEAANALISYIFKQLNAHKVIANCATENAASWHVMEKLRLQREGLLKDDFKVNDTWYDSYSYGITKSDWYK